MRLDTLVEISGFLNAAAGMLLMVYWFAYAIFLPYGKLSTTLSLLIKQRHWVWINSLGVFGALSGLLGQAGIVVYQAAEINGFIVLGFYIASAGTTLLIGSMLWDTLLWPILVDHDESLLDFQGPIYSSRTFIPYFIAAGLIYGLGYVFVGIGIIQASLLPPITGYLIAIGAPLFSLGTMFGKLQVYPRSVGVSLMAVGLVWIGVVQFI